MANTGQKRKSALDEIIELEEKTKEKVNRKDYWLTEVRRFGVYHNNHAVLQDSNELLEILNIFNCGIRIFRAANYEINVFRSSYQITQWHWHPLPVCPSAIILCTNLNGLT